MRQKSVPFSKLAIALAVCGAALAARSAQAIPLVFNLDPTQSYVSLAIPNFSLSGNNVNVSPQNSSGAWSSGNKAFVSGTLSTQVGGSFTGKTLSAIQFIGGANSLVALTSGSYRPNPAAYNAITSVFNNNGSAPANYGAAVHVILGNAALLSFSNTTFDTNSAALPASNTVGSGTFTSSVGNPLQAGINTAQFNVQGLSVLLIGQVIPNIIESITPGNIPLTSDTVTSYTYTYTSATNLQIKVGLSTPIVINVSGTFINGTASGQYVANATVPEPSTLGLAGLGLVSLIAVVRRKQKLSRLSRSP